MILEFPSQPGVKRDGTTLDNAYYVDAQWTRFQRGRPRKIGGYRAISTLMDGPVRTLWVDARATQNTAHAFSGSGVQQLVFDSSGLAAGLSSRTPAGFTPSDIYTWQACAMFQSGGGGTPLILCSATPDLTSIASDAVGKFYRGDITTTAALTVIQDGSGDITASGGCTVLQPFFFVYGSNGLIRNSNPNDVSTATGWTTGGANTANTANVAGSKIIAGLPVRGGGQSPAGLFWALDSLIRVSFVGGTSIWKYDTLSSDITILAKNCVVEYDNLYYWVGSDRFYVFNGVVQELPNDMNSNYFFDNLNVAQRQKVWALKVPRFGEIWWFFPTGTNTECDAAVIYNVKMNTWYDTRRTRSAGFEAKVFTYPTMTGDYTTTTQLAYTPSTGSFTIGEAIVGGTSGAAGRIVRTLTGVLNLVDVAGVFVSGETITDTTHGGINTGTISAVPTTQILTNLWQHEYGTDEVAGSTVTAVQSYVKTSRLQLMTELKDAPNPNLQTRVLRVEPDFVMSGGMTLTATGTSFAQSTEVSSATFPFTATTEFVDLREQFREVSLRYESNVVGGDYQMGKVLVTVEPGDARG